jgi:fructokinase
MRIGVDLGGTKIEAAVLNDDFSIALRKRVSTPAGDYDATVRAIAALVREMEESMRSSMRVGVGTPGALSADGTIKNANSTVLIGKPLKADLERALGREIRMTNDANCFALSESIGGAAGACGVVFGVILGTGVGGGITVRRTIVEGTNAIAGEWGHAPLPWPERDELPGPACYCGKSGCIETFLSGPALTRSYAKAGGEALRPTEIAERVASDPLARTALDIYLDRLARGLAVVINILDPDAIVFGGGVSRIDELYEALPGLLPRYVFTQALKTQLLRATHGDSSGVRGAAMLWQ